MFEHVGNVFAFVSDLERFAIVTLSVADFAFDINVRQKMHLDFDQPAAFAIFAASAFDIETEPPGIVSADARRRQLREKFANGSERAGVGDRIRARRSSDRALIDHDRLVEMVEAAERAKRSRFFFRVVKMTKERAPQNVIDQRRFAAAGNAGHAGQAAERKRGGRSSFRLFSAAPTIVSQPSVRPRGFARSLVGWRCATRPER